VTPLLSDRPPSGGWTVDDLAALPEDGVRRELIDGVLNVQPSRTDIHQIIAMRVMVALEETCPDDLHVTQAVEARFSKQLSLIPDGLVTTDEAARRGGAHFHPHEIRLAVEIVSPFSETLDRVLKPVLYANAGIPFYWLIESDGGLTVHAYELADGAYRPSGSFTETIELDQPWRIRIPMARLRPRQL